MNSGNEFGHLYLLTKQFQTSPLVSEEYLDYKT